MRSITRSHRSHHPAHRAARRINLGEFIYLCHEHALARGLDEDEANELTARVVGQALRTLDNPRLLSALASTSA